MDKHEDGRVYPEARCFFISPKIQQKDCLEELADHGEKFELRFYSSKHVQVQHLLWLLESMMTILAMGFIRVRTLTCLSSNTYVAW